MGVIDENSLNDLTYFLFILGLLLIYPKKLKNNINFLSFYGLLETFL